MTTHRPGKTRLALLAVAAAAVALIAVATGSARSAAGPTNVTEPTIVGAAIVGETLIGNRGVWSGAGITYQYQWIRCAAEPADDTSTCKKVQGQTGTLYVLDKDDRGKRLRFTVKASTKGGNTTAVSNPTSVVQSPGGKPVAETPPTISGSAIVGQTLTANKGSWVGTTPIVYTYRWLRCNASGSSCSNIGGATKPNYKVVKADVDRTLRVRVFAENSNGKGDAFSVPTDLVKASGAGTGGIITLPDGSKSVDVRDVPKGERLIVDKVVFSPNPLTSSTQSFLSQVRVKDSRGYVVRGAIVFIRTTPRVANGGDNSPTSVEGWVQYSLPPTADMQKMTGFKNLQLFVKAYRKGDPELGGISGTRLVQVGLNL